MPMHLERGTPLVTDMLLSVILQSGSFTEKPPRSNKNQQAARRQLTICETGISKLEERCRQLDAEMEQNACDAEKLQELYREKQEVEAQLEQEMARIVDSYQCEWQTTLNDPQRLALFRSFVNSNQPDEAVQRRDLRGQPQPLLTEPLP